jgi:hypothetical protein
MRSGGSSAKGSQFERDVCRKLSLWVTYGQDDEVFWRTAGSGSMATNRRKAGKKVGAHEGDIGAVKPAGRRLLKRYYVECKFYKDLKFMSYLLKQSGTLQGHWDKARKEAKEAGRLPLLIAKQNLMPTFVVLNGLLNDSSALPKLVEASCSLRIPNQDTYVILFDDFLNIQPEHFGAR